MQQMLILFLTFATHIARRSPIWVMWVGMQTFWKAFISLILDLQKSGSFESEFKDEAAIDVYGYDCIQW